MAEGIRTTKGRVFCASRHAGILSRHELPAPSGGGAGLSLQLLWQGPPPTMGSVYSGWPPLATGVTTGALCRPAGSNINEAYPDTPQDRIDFLNHLTDRWRPKASEDLLEFGQADENPREEKRLPNVSHCVSQSFVILRVPSWRKTRLSG